MMRKDHKSRRGGYTMAEVLMVVALIGILAAIAIPSVIAYRRALRLTELDDNARTIYLAAQSNLTALRSASDDALTLGDAVGRRAAAAGAAIPTAGTGADWKYVSTDDLSTDPDWLVLPGSVDSALTEADSCYLVEFDPNSGVVYGVFYTELGDGRPLTGDAYQTLYQYASGGGDSCRVRAGRDAFAASSGGFLVGYYGADGLLDLTRPDAQKLPTPKLKLINAEELVLEFKATAQEGVDVDNIFYAVSVTDGAHAKTLVEKGSFLSDRTNTVVLDTLKGGYSTNPGISFYDGWTAGAAFSAWVNGEDGAGPVIVPGADITVTVSTWYQPAEGEGMAALPQSASVTTNSLFGQRRGQSVEVGYGRHLQNLGAGWLDATITAALQVRDVDFARTTERVGDERENWAETYGAKAFVPIKSPNLTSYDGAGRTIRALNAVGDGDKGAGLFETLPSNATVEQVTLVDAVAKGDGPAGALAGTAQSGAVVDGCRIYITPNSAGKYTTAARIYGRSAGGLIGQTQGCTVRRSFASTVVQGSENAGGLVGRDSGGVTIEKSYAAGRVSGPKVGGLVGGGWGTVRVTDSYAAGLLRPNANGEAAGLCVTQANLTRAYAAADYETREGESYTISGAAPAGSTCANVFYLTKSGVNDALTLENVTAVAGTPEMLKSDKLAGLGAAFREGGSSAVRAYPYNHVDRGEEGPLAAPYPYPTLQVPQGGETERLPHYGDWLEATAPPAPQSLIAYYEQFLSATGYTTEYSCFINGAETGTLDLSRTEAIDADGYAFLSAEKLHNDWVEKVNLTVTAVGMETKETPAANCRYMGMLDEELNRTDSEPAYYVYAIPSTALDVIPDSGCYNEVTVHAVSDIINQTPVEVETTAWVNPLFGRSAYNGAKPAGDPGVIHIRSLRQLANIGRFFGENKYYIQDLDIDAEIYRGDLAVDRNGNSLVYEALTQNDAGHATIAGFEVWRQSWDRTWGYWTEPNAWNMPATYRLIVTPIGAHDSPGGEKGGYAVESSFNANYDGNGRSIRALSIRAYYYIEGNSSSGTYYAGLFHRVRGTLRNVHLYDCDIIGATGLSNNATGALVARLSRGKVIDCSVTNCTVTAQGTKANGHLGGLIGSVDDKAQAVQGCTVENCTVAGGDYIRNVGGMIGYVYGVNTGAVQDCTVKNVQVSGNFTGKLTDAIEKRGSMGGFVGCVKDSAGALENCAVIGTGNLGVSGSTWNVGGFAGSVSNGSIKNCGVRLEGRAGNGYATQAVGGGLSSGGFVGAMNGGTVTASYAAVKVECRAMESAPETPAGGGFAGTLAGGTVSNCYAGGNTKGGKYSAGQPNVAGVPQTGAYNVGGFAGLWKSGDLDTCYTTCAVSGAIDARTDVYANLGPDNQSPSVPNCYALGEAFVNGAKRGRLTTTSVTTSPPEELQDQRTEAHPYDTNLGARYPYAPVKYNGAPVPHYGDWPEEGSSRTKFEWDPIPEEFEKAEMEYVQSAEANWSGDTLEIEFVTVGHGTTLANIFSACGGHLTIVTDLGYTLTLEAQNVGGVNYQVMDENGNIWDVVLEVVGYTDDWQPIRSYKFTLPSAIIPPYLKTINIGGFKQAPVIDEVKNTNPDASSNKPVAPFLPGDSVVIDGSFDDWTGYPHQLLARSVGNAGEAIEGGNAVGAAFGDDTTIYIHIRNEHPTCRVSVPYTGQIGALSTFRNLSMTVEGDPDWAGRFGDWYNFINQTYTGPGIYRWVTERWDTTTWEVEYLTCVEAYVVVREDGTHETEMVVYLDRIAGQEVADQIDGFTVFLDVGGSLTIHRDLSEKNR